MAEAKSKRAYKQRAIVRQEGETNVAFLERKLHHEKALIMTRHEQKLARYQKRLDTKRKQLKELASEIEVLEQDVQELTEQVARLAVELGLDEPTTTEG